MKYESNSVEFGVQVKWQFDPSIAELGAPLLCVKKAVGVSLVPFCNKYLVMASFIIFTDLELDIKYYVIFCIQSSCNA